METQNLEAGAKVYDSEMKNIGQGIILLVSDNLIEVFYKDIEEVLEYSWNDAINFLNVIE